MSEPIPEAIPSSATHKPSSSRPHKRQKLTPSTAQAAQLSSLFAKPDRPIHLPPSTSLTTTSSTHAPPEIVANVQGSSAGAGSGEFHVYKASRRREYERLRLMDEEVKKEEEDKEARERREELERRDREKTERNRLKREKARARKMKGKGGNKGGNEATEGTGGKKKLVPNNRAVEADADAKDGDAEGVTNGGGEVKDAEEVGLVIEDDD